MGDNSQGCGRFRSRFRRLALSRRDGPLNLHGEQFWIRVRKPAPSRSRRMASRYPPARANRRSNRHRLHAPAKRQVGMISLGARRISSMPRSCSASVRATGWRSPPMRTKPMCSSSTPAPSSIRPRRNPSRPSSMRTSSAACASKPGPEAHRQRLHGAAFFQGTGRRDARGRCLHRARPGRAGWAKSSRPVDAGALAPCTTTRWEPLNLVTRNSVYIPDYDTPRFRLTPAHTAYVKIAEGCNHPCCFCVIPQMRGRHRSRTIESVVARGAQPRGRRA